MYGANKMNGSYFKDIDNDLNKFVGEWVFQDGNKKLTLKFIKIINAHTNFDKWNYYEDRLVGEYKYEENNVVIVNTLNILENIEGIGPYDFNINGNSFSCLKQPINNGASNERELDLFFSDPSVNYLMATIRLKYFIEGGAEKINAIKFITGSYVIPDDAPAVMRVPDDTYILIKQP